MNRRGFQKGCPKAIISTVASLRADWRDLSTSLRYARDDSTAATGLREHPAPGIVNRLMSDRIHYACQRCTNCCRWPGFVKIDDADIAAMAGFLRMPEFEFIQRYTRLRQHRDGLALTEKPNGECVFLDGRDCSVQPVKPRQCRGFPNEWNFPGWREVCEAIPIPVNDQPS